MAFRLCEAKPTEAACGASFQRPLEGATVSIDHRNRQHLAAQCCTERALLSNHFFFVSCLPAGVFSLRCLLFVSSRCHGRNVGRIMTKKGSCQPLFERTWGLSFFFAPFCHAQPSPAPSRLVFSSTNLEDAIQLAMVRAAMCVRDAGASSAICVACALMGSGQPHTALNMEGERC